MSGGVGLEITGRYRTDLVLLDSPLPNLPGEEVLRRLRLEPSTSGIPVIVSSAEAIPERAAALIKAGAFSYLKKPLEIKEFLRLLQDCNQ